MRLRLYRAQVVAGALLAILMQALIAVQAPWANNSLIQALEAGSFLFCCAGIMTGGRDLKAAFDAMGQDTTAAKNDAAYMQARAQLQTTAVVAAGAIGLLLARRFNIDPVYPLIAAGLLGLSLPFVNRMSGWGKPRT